jgi:signal peptidase I
MPLTRRPGFGTAVVWLVAGALVIAMAWTTRLATRWPSVYFMTGASMEPTVRMEEYFLAWSPPGRVARGDLVIFRFEDDDGVFHVLRRVAGLSGDTVSMRDGAVVVNGVRQPWAFRIIEPGAWRSALALSPNLYEWGPWIVPPDSVALLADTRDVIGWPDSRFIGFVSRDDVIARATRTVRGRRLK